MIDCLAPPRRPSRVRPFIEVMPQRQSVLPLDRPVVLIVDDEACVRDVLRLGLEREGFEVLLAASSWEALGIYDRRWPEIDAVVLDLCMPGVTGPQALRCMRHINPEVRACFMSGGMYSDAERRLAEVGSVRVLWKPFPLDEIAQAIREVLREKEVMSATA